MTVRSTHQCFQLIYFLLYHAGCLGCKFKNEKELFFYKRYKLYGYIYRTVYLTGLIGGFLNKIYTEELREALLGELSPVIKVILAFECIICPITYVEVAICLEWYQDKYVELANTLQTLDDEMQAHFPAIQWNYEKNKRKYNLMTVCIYAFYAIASTIYIFNLANCWCGWVSSTMLSICYACVTGGPALAVFLFIGNMDFLRLRFRLIRKLLRPYLLLTNRKPQLENIEDISNFQLLETYFQKYSSLIVPLNQVFSMVSISSLFHDFAIITSLGYLLCSKALDTTAKTYEYVYISTFMAPRIYKVINTALYGYETEKSRNNCYRDILKIGYLFTKSSSVKQQTEAFLHWRMHNNYRITVGKVLNCNLSLISLTCAGNWIRFCHIFTHILPKLYKFGISRLKGKKWLKGKECPRKGLR